MGNACNTQNALGTKTGMQCLESVTILYVLAKESQEFLNSGSFGNINDWKAGIDSGDLAPLWELYDFANANTDATFYENRNFKKETSKATKVYEAEVYLDLCAHRLLKSYENSGYSRLYEVTEDGFIIGVLSHQDGKIRGQSLKDFNVGIRNNATTDKVPNTKITATFSDYEQLEQYGIMITPTFDPMVELEGILAASVAIQSTPAPSKTGFTARIYASCAYTHISELTSAHVLVINGDGSTVAESNITLNDGGSLEAGYTIVVATEELAGVIKFGLNGTVDSPNDGTVNSGMDTFTIAVV